jgi:cobalt-zinc-cadmium efflux system outer membrane protein
LTAALTNSPELMAYAWEVRAREAEALQAGMRPNPGLGVDLENWGGGGDFQELEVLETTLVLSQLIEFGGKRGKRLRLAEQEQGLASWDYETARLDVITETKKAFLQVLVAQHHLQLAAEIFRLTEEELASVMRRVKAGSTSLIESNGVRVELETQRIARDQAQHALAVARKKLTAQWGGTTPAFSEVRGNLELVSAPPSLQELFTRIDQNPALARWATEMEHRRATLDLEESLRSIDLSVGAGFRYLNEVNVGAFVLALGMPLPVFDRNQGAIKAAEMRLQGAREHRRSQEVRLKTQLGVTHDELQAHLAEIHTLRDRALPEARQALQTARDAYESGSARYLDVILFKRLLVDLKARYYTSLVRFHEIVADLEQMTGEPIMAIGEPDERQEP